MILDFSVENYKSIKGKVNLNLTASPSNELLESNVIEGKRYNILKSAVIYGPNAGGKSNLLNALVYYLWFINNSVQGLQTTDPITVFPFVFCEETENEPSRFEMTFLLNEKKYRYGFSATSKEIKQEWLLYSKVTKEYPLFLRNKDEIDVYEEFEGTEGLIKKTRTNSLFLSVCSQFSIDLAEDLLKYFFSIETIHGLSHEEYRSITEEYLEKKETKTIIEKLLTKADLGIKGIDIFQLELDDVLDNVDPNVLAPDKIKEIFENKKTLKSIVTLHESYKNNELSSFIRMPISTESDGTIKYFNLLGTIVGALKNGTPIIIDEFDARLHSLMIQTIVKLFNSNKINTNAQLILTAHNPVLLDKNLLRRDQIYFIEKDKYGASHLYSLLDYKARKQEPYYKNYLDGRYGAIPMIGDIEEAFNGN